MIKAEVLTSFFQSSEIILILLKKHFLFIISFENNYAASYLFRNHDILSFKCCVCVCVCVCVSVCVCVCVEQKWFIINLFSKYTLFIKSDSKNMFYRIYIFK